MQLARVRLYPSFLLAHLAQLLFRHSQIRHEGGYFGWPLMLKRLLLLDFLGLVALNHQLRQNNVSMCRWCSK